MSKRNYKRQIKKQSILYKNRCRMPDSDCEQNCNINSANEIFDNEDDLAVCVDNFVPPKLALVQKLKQWYTETGPSRDCFQKLLKILHDEGLDVPLSAETVLGKREQIIVKNVFPGVYCHIGVETQLTKLAEVLKKYDEIIVDMNIDGIPLFQSSRMQLWPILLKIVNVEEKVAPFPVGIYVGHAPNLCLASLGEICWKIMYLCLS